MFSYFENKKKIWTNLQKLKQAGKTYILSAVFRSMLRASWLVRLHDPVNLRLLNISSQVLSCRSNGTAARFLQVSPNQAFACCWESHRLWHSRGGDQEPSRAPLSLEHDLHGSPGWRWFRRGAGLRKSSPTFKIGFLLKEPSHQPCHAGPWATG